MSFCKLNHTAHASLRSALLGLLLIAAMLPLSACGEPKVDPDDMVASRPQIAFVSNCTVEFWVIAEAGVRKAAKEFNVDAIVRMPPSGTAEEQKAIIEDLVSLNVDGLAVSPIHPENQADFLSKIAKDRHLITHDSDAPKSNRLCFVGIDNYTAGRECGKIAKKALPDGGKLMIFVGRLSQANAILRRQGVIDELLGRSFDASRFDDPGEVIEGSGYTILGTLTDSADMSKAKANAEDTLARYPDLDAMVGLFAYNVPACLEALDRAGRLREVKVIAFDEDRAALKGIEKGTVEGTVVQNPFAYGYESVRILAGLARGDRSVLPESGFLKIPARVITKENVKAFTEELDRLLKEGK